ncbi:hypothetical protein [Coleofasciculus sp. FACHB-712]|nr:hypothetical protein [Coleofasciculus sp. FACHB-712]
MRSPWSDRAIHLNFSFQPRIVNRVHKALVKKQRYALAALVLND